LAEEELLAIRTADRFKFDDLDSLCDHAVSADSTNDNERENGSWLVDGEEYVLARAGTFKLERARELENVLNMLTTQFASHGAGSNTPLLMLAASGMGKSTLLAQVVQAARENGSYDLLHCVFVGSVEGSTDALNVGRALCMALSRDLAVRVGGRCDTGLLDVENLPADMQGISGALSARLKALHELKLKVLLVIDAINELESGRSLGWIPRELPLGVQMLFSSIVPGGESGDAVRAGGARGEQGIGESLKMTRDAVDEVMDAMRKRWGLRVDKEMEGGEGGGAGAGLAGESGEQGASFAVGKVYTLAELSDEEVAELLRGTIEVEGGAGGATSAELKISDEHMAFVTKLEHCRSPLFLRLLAEEIVRRGSCACIENAADGGGGGGGLFPGRIEAVFDMLLRAAEEAGDMGAAKMNGVEVVASLVHCSQGGLFVGQLQQILEDALPPSATPATGAATKQLWERLKRSCLASVIRLEPAGHGAGTEQSGCDSCDCVSDGFVSLSSSDSCDCVSDGFVSLSSCDCVSVVF
jgi:hypothetical protein